MVGIPTAATMILGHHHPTPTVATPITRKTYRCTVTATTIPSEFNDLNEIRDLAEIIKQYKYLEYDTYYFSN